VSTQIDQFCENLRSNMTMIDDNLRAVKAKAVGKADEAERAARQQMESLQKKIDAAKAAVEAAKPKIDKWVEEQKSTAQSKIAEWKAKGDEKSLQMRADMADAYASATSTVASSAVDEAAKAALEAWIARYDVEASRLRGAGG
jgi:predicted  nucleic acid-binding Zn-ribbon protein